jgi:hypothetical protein
MGILAMPSRIWILATGSWKVSQQYNGHDKIACFYAPARLAATDGPTARFCHPGASLRTCPALKPFNR